MTFQQVLDLIVQLQAAVVALQGQSSGFSQADIDAAVAAAVAPLNDQISAMQAQITGIPDQIHDAVVAEDAVLAAKIKPLIDQLNAALSA